ncbi:hypothetical protein GCM10010403_39620 [Glycomyces rutgersensis]|uniref:Uncharacterized protein n=1 Tax=Glycomyces rutgersensis TaxID=58115 RepID=A0ABN3G2D1_9ACTN
MTETSSTVKLLFELGRKVQDPVARRGGHRRTGRRPGFLALAAAITCYKKPAN